MVAWLGLGDHRKEHMVEIIKLLHCRVTVPDYIQAPRPWLQGKLAQPTQENLPNVFQHLKFSRARQQSLEGALLGCRSTAHAAHEVHQSWTWTTPPKPPPLPLVLQDQHKLLSLSGFQQFTDHRNHCMGVPWRAELTSTTPWNLSSDDDSPVRAAGSVLLALGETTSLVEARCRLSSQRTEDGKHELKKKRVFISKK